MNYWHGKPINSLAQPDMEQAANEAINALAGMQLVQNQRESLDTVLLSFAFGAVFAGAAISVGLLLH
jgi:ABC-type nitrate/sulfonate/bicarbonate transport system permease component